MPKFLSEKKFYLISSAEEITEELDNPPVIPVRSR